MSNDTVAIISTVSAVISSISAFTALLLQYKSKKDLDKERREFSKPLMYIISLSKSLNKFEFTLKNRAEYCITELYAEWKGIGNPDIDVDIIDLYWGDDSNTKKQDYNLILHFKGIFETDIEGDVILKYKDVYGNEGKVIKHFKFTSMYFYKQSEYILDYDLINDKKRFFQ